MLLDLETYDSSYGLIFTKKANSTKILFTYMTFGVKRWALPFLIPSHKIRGIFTAYFGK